MKPKDLMKHFFTKCASHCTGEAQHHDAMSKAHRVMTTDKEVVIPGTDEIATSKTAMDSPYGKLHKLAEESHAERAKSWADLGETCCSLAKMCDKADVGEFEKLFSDAIVPSAISRVAPDNPQTKLKMVLRPGMPTPEAPKPDPQFAKLFSMDDGSEEA
jgi:hypothetical protein